MGSGSSHTAVVDSGLLNSSGSSGGGVGIEPSVGLEVICAVAVLLRWWCGFDGEGAVWGICEERMCKVHCQLFIDKMIEQSSLLRSLCTTTSVAGDTLDIDDVFPFIHRVLCRRCR